MDYTFSARTDPGLLRRNNEDAVIFDERWGVAVLADGMGGYNAGEVASGMTTHLIAGELTRFLATSAAASPADDICRILASCVDNANQAILQAAKHNPDYKDMGTTLVAGIFYGDRLILTHVGDSRCYRLRDGILLRITKDHSMLQEQVDAGLIMREDTAMTPSRHILTRALGVDPELQFEVKIHPVVPGDFYLMCSDGLTDMVDDASIASLMLAENNIVKLTSALINLANAKGGRDNIAVVLIHAKSAPDQPGKLPALFVS
ncbi:Stp1/IreP family PP2C-type Ser/Thr phosphatase [Rhodoferax sp.]|uniref:Stp1/IreP family PP2C-type Ser/Thr phosphatase n=1 Tax=Rhodoferax sp. TaxID=50421 RepID=UPI0025F613DA|nr:Stp1/IreP family PP2C-type Ser/Thr phosphatase [Rhodoferax sp.]